MSEYIKILTDKNFDAEVIQSKNIVLVDFWADWCNPCLIFAPIFEKVSKQYNQEKKIIFSKINIDHNINIPEKYNIMSIPTLVLFHNGKVINRKTGSISENELIEFIDTNLKQILK